MVSSSSKDEWWRLSNNAALFRAHPALKQNLPPGNLPGSVWHWQEHSFAKGAKAQQVDRVVEQICLFNGLSAGDLAEGLSEAVVDFLDRQPVEATRERKPRSVTSRFNPGMRLMELFDLWHEEQKPSEQCTYEYKSSVEDFIDFVGNISIGEITNHDLLDYRDEAKKLPNSMKRAERALSFTERVALGGKGPRISAATQKKRVGAIQAMLSFAKNEQYLERNEGRDVKITGYKKGGRKRITFQRGELQNLLFSPLFTNPGTWRSNRAVSHATLYWLFFLGLTTGARLEEAGQAAVADIKKSDGIRYIDIDDYVPDDSDETKLVKTDSSRRLVPIHDHLIELGFERYLAAIGAAGHTQLFQTSRSAPSANAPRKHHATLTG